MTTTSDAALGHYVDAVDAMLAGRSDVDRSLDAALADDADMVMALVLRSLRTRMSGDVAESVESLRRAGLAVQAASERERSVVAFFQAFFGADRFEAERLGLEHLQTYPTDRLVVWYLHFLYNMLLPTTDRRLRHRALARQYATVWDDDWFLVGERAFIATEAGEHAEARTLAERSLEARPENVPAAHAMAHAVLETGSIEEGCKWLGAWLQQWGPGCTQLCHLTWHQALLDLADGDSVAAARRLDDIVDDANPPLAALSDGASLMWRLHLEGWSEPLPWHALELTPVPPGLVFGVLHRSLVSAGLGRSEQIRTNAGTLDGVVAEACRSLADFVDGDAKTAANRLLAHETELVTLGGSRAQLEVLDDTLIAALAASGRTHDAAQRLDTRLARRPTVRDQRWRESLAA